MTKILKIATEFSDTPGPRYKTEGPYSGEIFREEVLYPQFQEIVSSGSKLVVDLDGTQGYGTSFLEEAFGGLIRNNHLEYNLILEKVEFISKEEPYLVDDIMEYLKAAADEA